MKRHARKNKQRGIYDRYRELLKAHDLTKKEIDTIRRHVQRLARTICEHVWGKKFF